MPAENLFRHVRPQTDGLNLPNGLSEQETAQKLSQLAEKNININKSISFLGGGVYNRYIPACVQAITERAEFLTSYTPYQPEASQGTLQAIFDYQTLICNLTGMDVSNASVYDGATACAEAVLMASRVTKRHEALVLGYINPETTSIIKSYCYGAGINVEFSDFQGNCDFDRYACVVTQNPDYLGNILNPDIYHRISDSTAMLVAYTDPVSVSLLKSPSEYGADIVVGDFQQLGISMSFGGPHGGFIACKERYLRQLPGRIVGLTKDKDGKEAFALTLQTREQHIRREKATSNICTNNALTALAATVYLSVLGAHGLREVASVSTRKAHYMARKLEEIPGFKIMNKNFLYEFTLELIGFSSMELIRKLAEKHIFIGIDLSKKYADLSNHILISVTELNSVKDIDFTVEEIKSCFVEK